MIKVGDKVSWGYWHHLNSRQKVYRVKTGVVITGNELRVNKCL